MKSFAPALLLFAIGAVVATLLALPAASFRAPSAIGSLGRRLKVDHEVLVRRAAALTFPRQALSARFEFTGAAHLTFVWSGGIRREDVDSTRSTVEIALDQGGDLELLTDAPIRIREVRLTRKGPAPWYRIALAAASVLAAAGLFWLGRGRFLVATIACSLLVPFLLHATLGGSLLKAMILSFAPGLVVLALVSSFLVVRMLPARQRDKLAAPPGLVPWLFAAATLGSCVAQVLTRPQPLLISDPAAYHDMGGRFAAVLSSASTWTTDGSGVAIERLRPYWALWATGLLYGILRVIRDGLTTIYVAQACAVAGAVFFLVRSAQRLGGRRLAIVAGTCALLYPPLAVICGIVQPEPFILLCWTLAFDLLLAGWATDDRRRIGCAGLAFGLGLVLHPQGASYLLVALILVLVPFVRTVVFHRPRMLAFALGLLPTMLTNTVCETYAQPKLHVLDRDYGFWAFTSDVPTGFWFFLDSDGWPGPLRLEDTRYVQGLRQAEQSGTVRGSVGRIAYTAGFVAENLDASLSQVLSNQHRLFHQPNDPSGRGWLLPYRLEVPWHRALVVLFLFAVPLVWARGGGALYVPFLLISATYSFYFAFNKYAIPSAPFLLLGAAVSLVRLVEERDALWALLLTAGAVGSMAAPAALVFVGVAPWIARSALLAMQLGGVATVFWMIGRRWGRDAVQRRLTWAAAACWLLPAAAVALHDVSWRGFEVGLDRKARYAVTLGEDGVGRLNSAREAFILLDLRATTGDPSALRLDFDSGLVLSGKDLLPSMPRFALATTRYHRDPATFPQWWRLAWRPEMAKNGRFGLTLSGSPQVRLRGELGLPDADGTVRGLSLGEWPHLSVYRLMHDGEYRHPMAYRLAGSERSDQLDGRAFDGALGIRLVALKQGGRVVWETEPAPATEVVTAIRFSAPRGVGSADVVTPSGSLRIDLSRPASVSIGLVEARVTRPSEEDIVLTLKLPAQRGKPLRLELYPLQELSSVARKLKPCLRLGLDPVPREWSGLSLADPVRIIAYQGGKDWRPAIVY